MSSGGDLPAVTESDELIVIHQVTPTEAIVLGPDEAIESISRSSQPIPANFVNVARRIAASAPELHNVAQAYSGRWVKLTRESADALQKYGATSTKSGAIAGVARRADGTIAKHLSFIDPGQASQVLMGLPTLAGAVAMQMQMASIEKKLDEIKESLEYVIEHLHDETLADVAANLGLLEDVYQAVERNGVLDDDHWDLLANIAQPVLRMHDLTSRRLDSLRSALTNREASVGRRAKALNTALRRDRTLFWLEAHVHAELALMRWQALYLLRQAEQHPETLEALLEELEQERTARHRQLQELANEVALFLVGGSRVDSWLEKVRIISRFRLDQLLTELEALLRVYRQELGTAGVAGVAALPAGPQAKELTEGEDLNQRLWDELLDSVGKTSAATVRVGRKVGETPARIAARFKKD